MDTARGNPVMDCAHRKESPDDDRGEDWLIAEESKMARKMSDGGRHESAEDGE